MLEGFGSNFISDIEQGDGALIGELPLVLFLWE